MGDEEETRVAPIRIKVDTPQPLDFANAATQWTEWLRRFNRFKNISGLATQANDVQIDTFLYILGHESEDIYEQLTFENGERTLEKVTNAFTQYFQPRTNTLNYRTQFYHRKQNMEESAEEYIRTIHSLAVKCRFSQGLTQDDMIKDRLLSGMIDSSLSAELQLDENVTLATVTSKMRAKETITKQMQSEAKIAAVRSNKQVAAANSMSVKPEKSAKNQQPSTFKRSCKFCGKSHQPRSCPAYGKACKNCGKQNHFASVCQQKAHKADEVTATNDTEYSHQDNLYIDTGVVDTVSKGSEVEIIVDGFLVNDSVHSVDNVSSEWLVKFPMQNGLLEAKIDTGAQANVMPHSELQRVSPQSILEPSTTRLTAYSGHPLSVLGVTKLELEHGGKIHSLPFHIIEGKQKGRTLIGLPSIRDLGLLPNVSVVNSHESVSGQSAKPKFIDEFQDVFTGFGKLSKVHKIRLKPDAVPHVCSPRSVPYALRDKLKTELDRLVSLDIITEHNEACEWLNQIVPVLKPDGSLRICLDPKNLNNATVRDRYSFPRVNDVYAKLAGSVIYSTLDAQSGFHQIALDEESSRLTTFLTPFGKYRYKRLPFGITSAPEFFHKTMVDMFDDLDGVEIYMDDILIHAPSQELHDKRLREVLKRCQEANLKLNLKKCHFSQSSVKFLGNTISKAGIQPSPEKVKAIQEAKQPTNKAEVRTLLGLVTYLAKFCPHLSNVTKPLRDLVKKDTQFHWEQTQEEAFTQIKNLISNAPVLALFDPDKEVVVNVDASSHSLGAVLLQQGKPIEFAAQSLTQTQSKYAQIEKEMLAIQFGLTHFHQYVYGRSVKIESDHLPLVNISQKPLCELSPRLQRMRMRIQHYDFTVSHVPGKLMFVSDYLSRSCPVNCVVQDLTVDDPLLQICSIVTRNPTVHQNYCEATAQDASLQAVMRYVQFGWPKQKRLCHELTKPYWQFRDSISRADNLLFYNDRLIIPKAKQTECLDQLHTSHQGITKTQQRARTALFWPGMCQQIEDRVSACNTCKRHDRAQSNAPLCPSEVPDYPWQIIGSDLFQLNDDHYLINVDYYSKWVNVSKLQRPTSNEVITEFRKQFSEYGRPMKIRSDNGPQYASQNFKDFVKTLDIQHVTSSPGYPRSNGQVERMVQTVKRLMIKAKEDNKCFWTALQMLRNTPLTSDLPSPSQLLQGRNLFDGIPTQQYCLFPRAYNREDVRKKFLARQNTMKTYHDSKTVSEPSVLKPKQQVRIQTQNKLWAPATVVEHHPQARSYLVKTNAGTVLRRNRQHIRPDKNTQNKDKSNHNDRNIGDNIIRSTITSSAPQMVVKPNNRNAGDNNKTQGLVSRVTPGPKTTQTSTTPAHQATETSKLTTKPNSNSHLLVSSKNRTVASKVEAPPYQTVGKPGTPYVDAPVQRPAVEYTRSGRAVVRPLRFRDQ